MFKHTLLLVATLFVSFSAFSVNINTASAKELSEALNGVGESKANAIIMYREKNGSFKTLKDLVKVKGIGAATIDKNREDIEL
ncbi:MAG: topoisomerase [Cycloclasticus sp. symbiont of Bathymodiolus heckerae]|nr:MAG: topoisomerase [Cycloclasticus sp. symbiont of Bathymodiolus heckerae]